MQHITIYLSVSSRKQDDRGQEPDRKAWAEHFAGGQLTKFYRDQMTGRSMNRPVWKLTSMPGKLRRSSCGDWITSAARQAD